MDPQVQDALDALRSWDFFLSPDSGTATLFEVWWHRYLRSAVVLSVVPPEAASYMVSFFGWGDQRVILELLENPDDRLGPNPEQVRDQILLGSLAGAVAYVEDLKSSGVDTWGDLHQAYFTHALSGIMGDEYRELLDVGPPMPKGGSGDTVNATFHLGVFEIFGVFAGASYRMVVDVGKWDKSIVMNTPGQSGDPNSPHYRDLFQPWVEDQAIPLLFSHGKIRSAAELIIRLKPSDDDDGDDGDDDDKDDKDDKDDD
jgi:penicillin amidase